MPRISAEARATQAATAAGRINPSPHLTAAEKSAWRACVNAAPAGHLSERDRPLLESWVSLTVAQRKLTGLVAAAGAEALADPKSTAGLAARQVESIGKTLAAISNRLKIGPLAGHSAPHKAGQRDETPTSAPLLGLRAVK